MCVKPLAKGRIAIRMKNGWKRGFLFERDPPGLPFLKRQNGVVCLGAGLA